MCLITLAYRQHPEFPLILVANRDERYDRPTEAAHFWPEQPDLLAGRDLDQGGTWLGVRRDGRWAAVTNFRDLERRRYPLSRGDLPLRFLTGNIPAMDFIRALRPAMPRYGGFNLLLGDVDGLYYCSNRSPREPMLAPGIYGLSNHLLDTPWPKLVRAREALKQLVTGGGTPGLEPLAGILADRSTYEPDPDHLPTATADPAMERSLSAAFINTAQFGTRCTTVLLISRQREALFLERSFDRNGEVQGQMEFRFELTS